MCCASVCYSSNCRIRSNYRLARQRYHYNGQVSVLPLSLYIDYLRATRSNVHRSWICRLSSIPALHSVLDETLMVSQRLRTYGNRLL